jgi:NitT/TauT family transport system permease protein
VSLATTLRAGAAGLGRGLRHPAVVGTALVFAAWALVTATRLVEPVFLPPPWAVLRELARLAASAELARDVGLTLQRTLGGFALGALLGVAAGLLMGYSRTLYTALEFPLDFFRSIPATALFPLFIVIFGLGDDVKVFVALWSSAMVVTLNTIYGVRAVSGERLIVARVKKTPFLRRFVYLVLPSALPYVLAGCRIGLSLALVVQIVAEMFLGASDGLGRRIYNATTVFDMEQAYASVLLIGLLGYGLNQALLFVEKRLVHWPA